MRNLLGTTALAVAIAASALAQTANQPPAVREAPAASAGDAVATAWLAHGDPGDLHASELIGAAIHAADAGEATFAARDDWESVGVVNDLLLTREGEVRAVLIDVGTFLGLGGKTVAAPLEALSFVTGAEFGEVFILVAADRETLQGAPAYERPSTRAEETTMTPTMPTSATMFSHDGYGRAENHALTADDLENATVYGRGDAKIGSISELIVNTDGKISDAVIDVGGFLGMGGRSVSMPFADLTVLRETGGDDVRVYIDATKEKLEAMPRHDG